MSNREVPSAQEALGPETEPLDVFCLVIHDIDEVLYLATCLIVLLSMPLHGGFALAGHAPGGIPISAPVAESDLLETQLVNGC